MKFREEDVLREVEEYIKGTYNEHYRTGKIDTVEYIMSQFEDGKDYLRGNILKYAARQGKKLGQERKDLFKIIHYAILMLYYMDQNSTPNEDK